MTAERIRIIRDRLEAEFSPQQLEIEDQSHLHAGHAGARDGRGHFKVDITAAAFADKPALKRHRLVYAALGELMQTDIHAVIINARSPAEADQKN